MVSAVRGSTYQEKSIGSSICDVMAVSSHLTGYEIKSDNDDYSRLDRQISAYNAFFDKNYLVVSSRHRKSAESKIPRFWGIICIEQENVEILRKASVNPEVSRRSQLSVLWKLELKNILIKNSMPMYAQKDKSYIAYQIANQIDSATLGKQIAYELYNRDYSYYDAKGLTIKSEGSPFSTPVYDFLEQVIEDEKRYDELSVRQLELIKEPYKAEKYIEQIRACENEIERIKMELLLQE